VVAASMWSNSPCKEIAPLDSFDESYAAAAFNIDYPHWCSEPMKFAYVAVTAAQSRITSAEKGFPCAG
jgi:hypothetical protein